MPARDLYQVLEVERRASAQDIKRAYYRLALRLHPDARQEADPTKDAQFAEIAEAYAVLGDPALRKRYDALGPLGRHLNPNQSAWQKVAQDPRRVRQAIEQSLSQLELRAVALDHQRRPHRSQGHAGTLRFAVNALTTWARKRRDRALPAEFLAQEGRKGCEGCQGSGAAHNSAWMACSMCNAQGTVGWQRGPIKLSRACSACQGRGKKPEVACPLCLGQPLGPPP